MRTRRAALWMSGAILLSGALPLAANPPEAPTGCKSSACADGELSRQNAPISVSKDDEGSTLETYQDGTTVAVDTRGERTCVGPSCASLGTPERAPVPASRAAEAGPRPGAPASALDGPVSAATEGPAAGAIQGTKIALPQALVEASFQGGTAPPKPVDPLAENTAVSASRVSQALGAGKAYGADARGEFSALSVLSLLGDRRPAVVVTGAAEEDGAERAGRPFIGSRRSRALETAELKAPFVSTPQ